MSLIKLQAELIQQVQREYSQGEDHIQKWRTDVQKEISEIYENIEEGKMKIDLVKENIDFERATFLTDDIDVKFVCDEGVLGREIMENANKVAKYDYIDTDRKLIKDRIITDCGYYGIAVEIMDSYDTEEEQPISTLVNPDLVIPDPKCHNGSYMRWCGLERRIPVWQIENNEAYNLSDISIESIEDTETMAMRRSEQARDEGSRIVECSEGLVDVYDHYTIYEGHKWLTTWVNNQSILIRAVKLKELSKAEKQNPMKIRFPVVFHRRRSHPYRWAGYRLREEVGNSQDIVTQLYNLQIAQARLATYGPDTMVDQGLGIDQGLLQKKKPGGRIIPVSIPQGSNIGNHIFQNQYQGNINLSQAVSQELLDRVKKATGYSDISMGYSPTGQQTKGEIQTLQNNANKILSWVSSSYLDGEKAYYTLWYRSYQQYMGGSKKKIIALFDNGGLSKTLKKKDFVSDGKVIIDIRSSAQEAIANEKSVTKLLALAQSIIPNLKSEQSINTFLRALVDKSGVDGLEGEDIIPYSVDERLAMSRLGMLNMDIPVMSNPEPGEDLKTHIDIYEEALDTKATAELLSLYNAAYMRELEAKGQQPQGQTDQSGTNVAMNMMQQQNNPNTQMPAGF